MKENYFEWKTFAEKNGNLVFPIDAMENIFLIDVDEERMWFSEKCARLLFEKNDRKTEIEQKAFEDCCLSETGRYAFRQAIQRLLTKNVERVSCHAAINGISGTLSTVIYLYHIDGCDGLFGHISVDYEPMREYEQHLEDVIKQLQHSQKVNELTVEGASDYIYQLDLINNVCTFSSKALEVLPLESPTFDDAMNRVLSFIIPEDRHIFLESFTPFLTGQSDRHTAEYRVHTKQGDIMWISCKGKGIHDEAGRPLMIAGSLLDITQQKKDQEEFERMLYFDSLTELRNRNSFEKDMEERLQDGKNEGSLLYMNIRKFKLYNELFGHNFGDKVLKDFAYMLELFFADSYGIYRFSGDEFVVHLGETGRKQIMEKLVPFQSVLKRNREIDGHSVYIHTQIAVVIYPEHGKTIEALLNNAHQCLYRMTREEHAEIAFYSGGIGDSVSQQFLVENEMRKDIENNFQHFRLVYQPIVRRNQNGFEWIGAEALLRYSNPKLPDLEQMDMIRTLEYSGLIVPVGRWVIEKAVHECCNWNRSGKKVFVHVNIAAQQISDVSLVSYMKEKCRASGLPYECLIVELTETSMLSNFEVAETFCKKLLRLGIGVALDDFGTGYSSFNYLRTLPISEIKIDRSYVRNLATNQYNQTFISFMYQLSKQLNLQLCVEGVETDEELGILEKMDVSVMQGFYFERPMEADVICREFPTKSMK